MEYISRTIAFTKAILSCQKNLGTWTPKKSKLNHYYTWLGQELRRFLKMLGIIPMLLKNKDGESYQEKADTDACQAANLKE